MGSRETDGLATLEELAAVLERQKEAVKAGEWETFAEASRRWNELTSHMNLRPATNQESVRQKLEELLNACEHLQAQLSDQLARHSASLVSIRQQRHVLHTYGGLGLNSCVSYFIDEKK